MSQNKGRITLTFSDDHTRSEAFAIVNNEVAYEAPEISGESFGHTVEVDIRTPTGESVTLTGDQWRALESEGNVDKFILLLDVAPGCADIVVERYIQAVIDETPIYQTIVTRDETCSGSVFVVGDEDPIDVAREDEIELTLDEGNHKKYDDWSANDNEETDLASVISEMLDDVLADHAAHKLQQEQQAAHRLLMTLSAMTKDGEKDEDGKPFKADFGDSHDTLMNLIDEARRILA